MLLPFTEGLTYLAECTWLLKEVSFLHIPIARQVGRHLTQSLPHAFYIIIAKLLPCNLDNKIQNPYKTVLQHCTTPSKLVVYKLEAYGSWTCSRMNHCTVVQICTISQEVQARGGVLRCCLDGGARLKPPNPYPSLRVILAEKGTHY